MPPDKALERSQVVLADAQDELFVCERGIIRQVHLYLAPRALGRALTRLGLCLRDQTLSFLER